MGEELTAGSLVNGNNSCCQTNGSGQSHTSCIVNSARCSRLNTFHDPEKQRAHNGDAGSHDIIGGPSVSKDAAYMANNRRIVNIGDQRTTPHPNCNQENKGLGWSHTGLNLLTGRRLSVHYSDYSIRDEHTG